MNLTRIITSAAAASASASTLPTRTTPAADSALGQADALTTAPVPTTLVVERRATLAPPPAPAPKKPAPGAPKITAAVTRRPAKKKPKPKPTATPTFKLSSNERSSINGALHTIASVAREAGKKVVNETAHAALVACANDIDSAFDEARLHAKNPPLPRAIQGAEDALEHAITPDEGGRGTGEKIDKKRKNLETVARRYGVSIGGAGKLTPPRAVWVGAAVGAGAWLV